MYSKWLHRNVVDWRRIQTWVR